MTGEIEEIDEPDLIDGAFRRIEKDGWAADCCFMEAAAAEVSTRV